MALFQTVYDDEREDRSKEREYMAEDYWSEVGQSQEIPAGLSQSQFAAPEKDTLDVLVEGVEKLKAKLSEYWNLKGVRRLGSYEAGVSGNFASSRSGEASTTVGQDAQRSWNQQSGVASGGLYQGIEEKLSSLKNHIMPEDRSPFWVCSVLLLVICLAIAGLRTNVQPAKAPKDTEVEFTNAQRVQLPDGRYISYREQGVPNDTAKHTVLVAHGLISSRFAGLPGVNDSLLEDYKVRLIAYDRPGYGQSDPHPGRTFNSSAHDIAWIADALGVHEKFWVLGYSAGGPYAWASIKYIPERLAGVFMLAPAGNPYAGNMTKDEIDNSWGLLTLRRKLQYYIARHYPALLPSFLKRTLIKKSDQFFKRMRITLGEKDQELLGKDTFLNYWKQDMKEALRQKSAGNLAEELIMVAQDWGFNLDDLCLRAPKVGFLKRLQNFFSPVTEKMQGFEGPIHIWQGTDDHLVPAGFADFAKRMVPQVKVHKLEHEGHFSWFCFCDDCHRKIFESVFGRPEAPDPVAVVVTELPEAPDADRAPAEVLRVA
ncbi:hypothetical protein O6H91_13G025700 [Diphasiastrum complanatum]|nr:hypothetical protein O6H91_13G025700 [Diphasiastrum complanatum]